MQIDRRLTQTLQPRTGPSGMARETVAFFRRSVRMTTSRWTVTCVALLGFASGCSEAPGTGRAPYKISNEGGLTTYVYELPRASGSSGRSWDWIPEAPASSGNSSASEPLPDLESGQDRQQDSRDQATSRQSQLEQSKLDQQNFEANQARLQQEEVIRKIEGSPE